MLEPSRFFSPPPAPPAGGSAPFRDQLRLRGRSAAVELVVAAGILAVMAASFGGGGTQRPPAPPRATKAAVPAPSPQASWSTKAVPAITRLIGDLGALDTDAGSGAAATAQVLTRDTATLQGDLQSANALGPPPAGTAGAVWSESLSRIGSALATCETAIATAGSAQSTSQLAAVKSAVEGAGDELLQLAVQLRSSP